MLSPFSLHRQRIPKTLYCGQADPSRRHEGLVTLAGPLGEPVARAEPIFPSQICPSLWSHYPHGDPFWTINGEPTDSLGIRSSPAITGYTYGKLISDPGACVWVPLACVYFWAARICCYVLLGLIRPYFARVCKGVVTTSRYHSSISSAGRR